MRTWFALASMMLTACNPVLVDGAHLDEDQRGDANIVGGAAAPDGVFTYQVSIQTPGGFHFCGGSVIDEEWILTAAHCVVGESANQLRVETGILRLSENGERLRVDQIIVHPNYSSFTSDNDIALLRLSSPTSAPPVALIDDVAEDDYSAPGDVSYVSGWGTLSSGGSSPDALQYVDVPIVSNGDCNAAYNGDITANMICAGYLNQGGADACQGDSGGPLVVEANGELAQTGVVSWGIGCASASYPGVYARVSRYESWISGFVPGVRFISDGGNGTGGGTTPTEPTEPVGDDHGDTTSTATVVDVDGVTTIDAFLDPGDHDVFRLELAGAGTLTVQTEGGTDTFGTLLSSGGSTLASNDDIGGGNYNFRLTQDADDGDVYYLDVRGYSGSSTGAYTLVIDGPAAGDGGSTGGGSDADVVLDLTSATSDGVDIAANLAAGAQDFYVIEVVGSSAVLSAGTTGNTDTYGNLYNADGSFITGNDDAGPGYNFDLAASVPAGIYILEVRGYSSSTSGAYDLEISATR